MDLLVIVGPTAVGKTEYAVEKAVELDGEIVSADATQVYKGLDIGSAKPSASERARAVHHLIDFVDPFEDFSVAEYQRLALDVIKDINGRGKLPILSGGTGLYVNSVIYDMDFSVLPKKDEFRRRLYEEADAFGAAFVHEKLRLADPAAAARIHPNNLKKAVRALEILEGGADAVRGFEESFVPRAGLNPRIIGLTRERGELYRRIERRVDSLLEAGLLEEVRGLMDAGLDEGRVAMKGIGYKELCGYFKGEYDFEEAVRLIKRNSRHYAKRQLTWFRRYEGIEWAEL